MLFRIVFVSQLFFYHFIRFIKFQQVSQIFFFFTSILTDKNVCQNGSKQSLNVTGFYLTCGVNSTYFRETTTRVTLQHYKYSAIFFLTLFLLFLLTNQNVSLLWKNTFLIGKHNKPHTYTYTHSLTSYPLNQKFFHFVICIPFLLIHYHLFVHILVLVCLHFIMVDTHANPPFLLWVFQETRVFPNRNTLGY